MLLQVLEIALNPLWLIAIFAWLMTYLLRHRLYLYASAGVPSGSSGAREHMFVIQNLEDVDLSVQLELALSTTSDGGRIQRVSLFTGKQGPDEANFELQGRERYTLTVLGIPALDTWKISCMTNDEAERVRLVVRGWDVRRKVPRNWLPAISSNGISITSRASAVQRELTRPANRVAWVCVLAMMLVYVSLTKFMCELEPSGNPFVFTQALSDYTRSLVPPLNWRIDGAILLGLLLVGGLGILASMPRGGLPIPLGYLGDPHLAELFHRWGGRTPPFRESASPVGPGPKGGGNGGA